MANQEQLEMLRQGIGRWNDWRERLPSRSPDLSNADLTGEILINGRFNMTDLRGANLSLADFEGTNFVSADLRGAKLVQTNLSRTDLNLADLRGAYLNNVKLIHANLTNAKVSNDVPGRSFISTLLLAVILALNHYGLPLMLAPLQPTAYRGDYICTVFLLIRYAYLPLNFNELFL